MNNESAVQSELELRTEGEIRLLWSRKIPDSPKLVKVPQGGVCTKIVQPFASRLFLTGENIKEIDPKDGSVLWESLEGIGILLTGLYTQHPEIVGLDQENLYAIVDNAYQGSEIIFYAICIKDGKVKQSINVYSATELLRGKGKQWAYAVYTDNKLNFVLDGGGVAVFDINRDNSVRPLNLDSLSAREPKTGREAYDYFDVWKHCFPENLPLKLNDVYLSPRAVSERGGWPKGITEVVCKAQPKDLRGVIEIPDERLVDTITRAVSSIFIFSGDILYNLEFPSKSGHQ
jgi:hypothetical protein